MTNQFKNILAFLIIISGDKVLQQSPDYIWEKYLKYVSTFDNVSDNDSWQWGLDSTNRKLFEEYVEKWKIKERSS